MTDLYYPLRSLREGSWFKLICGASFQHLSAVRNLTLAYTLAGADCIDVAADPAVVLAAKAAIEAAAILAKTKQLPGPDLRIQPWLMASFNDGEDPHFRKAEFEANNCPSSCHKPCETICPAQAISFGSVQTALMAGIGQNSRAAIERSSGVISDRCYGCGRCLPVCPIQHISTRSYVSTPAAVAPLVLQSGIDAIEIHTQVGHLEDFQRLWRSVLPWVHQLKLISISCPDDEHLIGYLRTLYEIISPLPCPLIWQTDGRPMSGDIGVGATRAALKLSQKVLAARLPGYVQLAGGTNHHTVPKLHSLQLLKAHRVRKDSEQLAHTELVKQPNFYNPYIAGVAYGSYARALLMPVLNQLEALEEEILHYQEERSPEAHLAVNNAPLDATWPLHQDKLVCEHGVAERPQSTFLEDQPALLQQAVSLANSLVSQIKSPFTVSPASGPELHV